MKKYISLAMIVCALLSTTISSAQEQSSDADDTKKVIWGVKAGMNISNTSSHGDDKEGRPDYRSPIFGFSGGATAEYKFNNDISLSSEILFSQQGVKYNYYKAPGGEYDDDEDEYLDHGECKVKFRFSYINVPILFNYYFVKDKKISLNIGIQMGFLVNSKSTTEFKYTDGTSLKVNGAYGWDLEAWNVEKGTYDRNDAGFYLFDLGVPMGLTWQLDNNLTFDARFNLGVLNTFRETTDYDYDSDYRSTNNSFTFSVGYKF